MEKQVCGQGVWGVGEQCTSDPPSICTQPLHPADPGGCPALSPDGGGPQGPQGKCVPPTPIFPSAPHPRPVLGEPTTWVWSWPSGFWGVAEVLMGLGDPLSSEHPHLPFLGMCLPVVAQFCTARKSHCNPPAAIAPREVWTGGDRGMGVGVAGAWLGEDTRGDGWEMEGWWDTGGCWDWGECWNAASETQDDPELAVGLCHPAPSAIDRGHP